MWPPQLQAGVITGVLAGVDADGEVESPMLIDSDEEEEFPRMTPLRSSRPQSTQQLDDNQVAFEWCQQTRAVDLRSISSV